MNASNRWISAALACRSVALTAVAVPWRRQHRVAGDVARGRRRRAVDRSATASSSRPRSRPARRPRRLGLERGDVLLAIDNTPVEDVADVIDGAARVGSRRHAPVHRAAARHRAMSSTSDWRRFPAGLAPSTSSSPRSARSRCSSAAPYGCAGRATPQRCTSSGSPLRSSASSPSRSADAWIASTGCSTGRTPSRSWRCRRCSCTSRWCSRSGRAGGRAASPGAPSSCSLTCRRSSSVSRASSALAWSSTDAAQFVRVTTALDRLEYLYLALCFIGGLARPVAGALAGVDDYRASAAALDCVGNGAGRRAVRARLRAAVCAGRRTVAADAAVGDPAQPDSARLRVGHRPLPADGHRGDRQARAGLRRGAVGDRRHLRGAARGGPARRSSGAAAPING